MAARREQQAPRLSSRRAALGGVTATTNAGLWLDKGLLAEERDEKLAVKKADVIRQVSEMHAPEGYRDAFAWRRRDFEAQAEADEVTVCEVTCDGRLVIGLGAKGVLEAGLRLEHTWGVPVLPGSALKGLAAAAAHLLAEDGAWRKPLDANHSLSLVPRSPKLDYDRLFGATDEQGEVIFHDGWWVPQGHIPIHLDVMTVHHPDYYQTGQSPPADHDSPTPVPFASVTGTYLVALEGPAEWREAAVALLRMGLEELGLGAKTNAGYGRMSLKEQPTQAQQRRLEEARKREEAAAARKNELAAAENRLRQLVPQHRGRGTMRQAIEAIESASRTPELRGVLVEVIEGLVERARGDWERWRREDMTDEQRALWDELVPRPAPGLAAPPPAQPPPIAAVAKDWKAAQAWLSKDERNREQVVIILSGETKRIEEKVHVLKPTDELKAKLAKASKEAPLAVRVVRRGKRVDEIEAL